MRFTDQTAGLFNGMLRVILVISLFIVLPCRATTQLILAHIYASDHPKAKACQYFSRLVRERSSGRVRIVVFGEASMGNQTPILRSMQNGSLDMAILSQGSLSAIVPEFNALGLPYLFPDEAAAWRVLDGHIGKELARKLEERGIVLLDFLDIETRQLSNSVRPVAKPEDLAGLRIRVPPDPLAGEVISAFGGTPREVNFSDLYDVLKDGVVDGQENPLFNFYAYKLYEVQKFVSLTGHKNTIYSLLIRKASLDALSSADQEIVRTAARDAARYLRESARDAEEDASRKLRALGGRIDKVEMKSFVAATAPVYARWYAGPVGDFVRAVVREARETP